MGDLPAALCHLVTRAHFAGVPTTRMLWSHVSIAIDASKDELSPEEMISRVLEASVQHPLCKTAPRDPKHDASVLKWFCEAWERRGWGIPQVLKSLRYLEEPLKLPELCYKTYVGWGCGSSGSSTSSSTGMSQNVNGVTLLESCGGIVHHTTGLTTWGGAAVLADWVTNNQHLIAGKRVLELGAGVGFTASVVLTSLSDDTSPPISYVATDCHHHVLTLLHHNLELNLGEEPVKKEDLQTFQEATEKLLISEETEVGEILPWNSGSMDLRLTRQPDPFSKSADEVKEKESEKEEAKNAQNNNNNNNKHPPGTLKKRGREISVSVLQVDWRQAPEIPDSDVILASDVVYAHHLIPPLVTLIKSILDGSASRKTAKEETKPRKTQRNKSEERKTKERGLLNNRAAYIACTRRTHETMNIFLEEVTKQGLCHSLVYQATLDPETFLFLYNETHLPVKIYKLVLPAKE